VLIPLLLLRLLLLPLRGGGLGGAASCPFVRRKEWRVGDPSDVSLSRAPFAQAVKNFSERQSVATGLVWRVRWG